MQSTYVPVMAQKLKDFVIGVAEIDSTDHAWSVQVSQVSNVRCVLWYLLERAQVTVEGHFFGLNLQKKRWF